MFAQGSPKLTPQVYCLCPPHILTVKGARRASGAAELLAIQHCHAGLASSPSRVVRWGYTSIHTPAPTAASPSHPLLGLQGLTPLLAEPLLVPEQTHQLAGLFSHVGPLVSAVTVHVLEVAKRLIHMQTKHASVTSYNDQKELLQQETQSSDPQERPGPSSSAAVFRW